MHFDWLIAKLVLILTNQIAQFSILFREDGIVIAISVWQTLIELLWSILYFSCVFVTEGQSIFIMECMLLLTYFMNYVIFPSFYLLADARFRNIFIHTGKSKALWLALTQKYD